MLRVVVAEDSRTLRELIVELLETDPSIEVVGQAQTGSEAIELALRLRPDLIAMDIHMPVMGGLEATKEIMTRAPTPIVLITSSASREDARLSLDALRAGALMILAKPDNPASTAFNGQRDHLLSMVKAMAHVKVVRHARHTLARQVPPVRARRGAAPRLVAIAASTGGPVALQRIFAGLPADCAASIVVVQHIAVGFAAPLAAWLGEGCRLCVKLAEHGEQIQPRTVYLAPDERHLSITPDARVEVRDGPAVGGHRPSATVLFESAARAYGAMLTAVILTGMGRDGVEGLRSARTAGAWIIAQDEATSVVHGMPGEAIKAGLADVVLPLNEIGPHLASLIAGSSDADPHPDR